MNNSRTTEELNTSPEDADTSPSMNGCRSQILSKVSNQTADEIENDDEMDGVPLMTKLTVSEIDYYKWYYPEGVRCRTTH